MPIKVIDICSKRPWVWVWSVGVGDMTLPLLPDVRTTVVQHAWQRDYRDFWGTQLNRSAPSKAT